MALSQKTAARQARKKRIRASLQHQIGRPRLVVSRSNQHIQAQLVDDERGVILAVAHDLKEKSGTKVERAKNVGNSIATEAKKKSIETCVFDRNGYRYHGRVKALAEAAREGGLRF